MKNISLFIICILILLFSCTKEESDTLIVFLEPEVVLVDNDLYAIAQCNVAPSKIFLVDSSQFWVTVQDLEDLSLSHFANSVNVTEPNTDVYIRLENLLDGKYYAYAVDQTGKISERSKNFIIVESNCGNCALVTEVNGVETGRTPSSLYCGEDYQKKINSPPVTVGSTTTYFDCD